MDIILKSVAGGIFVGLILWLSKTRFSPLAGLLLFFPIISLPTFFFLGSNGELETMRRTILWSFWSVPVWLLFALTLYLCSYKLKVLPSISIALAVWFIGAALLIYFRTGS